MPPIAIAILAAGTYGLRLVGPLLQNRLVLPERIKWLLSLASIVLLMALVATASLLEGGVFAGWARPAGVLLGGVLVIIRAPFPIVVIAAAMLTALLRLIGIS